MHLLPLSKGVMKIVCFYISLFFLNLNVLCASNKNIDSLHKAHSILSTNDTAKVNELITLIIKKGKERDYVSALKYAHEALLISKKKNYLKGEATSYRLISTIYLRKSDFEKSIANALTAIAICENLKDEKELYKNYTNLGNIYLEQGLNQKALGFHLRALKIGEKLKDEEGQGSLYNSIGNINDNLKNFDKAILYYRNALKIFENTNSQNYLAGTLSNIGTAFNHKNLDDSALVYYLRASDSYKKLNDQLGLAYIYNNIGVIYSKKDDPKKALFYYEAALKYTIPFQQKKTESTLYKNIGDIYIATHNIEKAELSLTKALEINKELNYTYGLMSTYKSLSGLYSAKRNYQRALEFFEKYTALKDSINSLESAKDINEKIIVYESDLKDKEIKLLNAEKLQKETINKKNIAVRNLVIIVVSSSALITIFLISFLSIRRQKMQQKQFLHQLMQSQEEERKRISKELHDGIGQSLLVIKNNMTEDKQLIDNTIDELRAISRNLHPVQLEKLGLKGAIESIINEVPQNSKIFFSCEIEDVNKHLNAQQQINSYRIVQESISNIIKHSDATDARVTLTKEHRFIKLIIIDNGIGFDMAKAKKKKTLGITSIEERVSLIGGELLINSIRGETKIELLIPYV